jgi:hypothetical protein
VSQNIPATEKIDVSRSSSSSPIRSINTYQPPPDSQSSLQREQYTLSNPIISITTDIQQDKNTYKVCNI